MSGVLRIGIRELRQQASRYIARVKAGESVEITERGVLVARLVPPAPGESARQRLIAQGLLQPARAPLRLPERRRVRGGTQEALDDVRDERL